MEFRSTRGAAPPVTFSAAIERGLAPDGGLYVPVRFPDHRTESFDGLLSPAAIAVPLLAPFFDGDPLEPRLRQICESAFDFPIPLRALDERTSLLELFHGPTAAFKDAGARFLAACMEQGERRRVILVATSGDTGGAIASAFHGRAGIDVVILFPRDGVSARQRHQLTCWGGNVAAFAVRGSFDDCQRLVKSAFADEEWRRRVGLTSANSINIGRLLPQTVYHATAALQYRRDRGAEPDSIVPSGNLGNACAALWARRMGLPLGRVVFATNANRTLTDYLETGEWQPRPSRPTLANAMDVGDPSNMERVRDLYPDIESLRRAVDAAACDDENIRSTIAGGPERWGTVFCPHTATAVHYRDRHPEGHAVIAATAHPAKFDTIVEPLIGEAIPLPPSLAALQERESRFEVIEPELTPLRCAVDALR